MWAIDIPLFWTSDASVHKFQSQGGFTITCALLSLAYNNPQSHLWLPEPGMEPGSLTCKASKIPLCQPDLRGFNTLSGGFITQPVIIIEVNCNKSNSNVHSNAQWKRAFNQYIDIHPCKLLFPFYYVTDFQGLFNIILYLLNIFAQGLACF